MVCIKRSFETLTNVTLKNGYKLMCGNSASNMRDIDIVSVDEKKK
jgi:hypothetical protein